MFFLSRQTVRRRASLYAGSFVALSVGVFLLGLAATATAATIAYDGPRGASVRVPVTGGDRPDRQVQVPIDGDDIKGLQTVLSIVGTISGFITIFVIASTFAFAVASRRRELGLLRLIGATPWQVRRMVLGEALVVAVFAAVAGAVLAWAATPLLLAKASYTDLAPVRLEPAGPWIPLGIATAIGLVVAMLGARSAARRAGRVGPVDALREADLDPRRIGPVRVVVGLLFLAGSIVLLSLIRPGTGEAVVPLAVFTPMLLVGAFTTLAPLVVPLIGRIWALPLVALTRVSGRLARANVLAAPGRSAALAAPILAISAIAGSMVLTLSFAADASTALIRDTVRAPIVITPAHPDGAAGLRERIAGTPGVAAVDGAIPLEVIRTDRGEAYLDQASGIDPTAATRTRNLEPLAGSLAELRGNTVAIAKELASFNHYQLGDHLSIAFTDGKTARLRIVAILRDAPEINTQVMLPATLAAFHAPAAQPAEWFVLPEEGADVDAVIQALDSRLAGTGADAMPAVAWEDQQSEGVRSGNQLGLILLLGPAALYSAIAIVNTLLMGSLQRRRELVTCRLLGATPAQLRRMVLWESTLVGAVALSLGTAITVTVAVLLRQAMTHGLIDVPTTVPWGTLLTIAATCLALATGAALAPTAYILRNSTPSEAVTD